MSSDSAARKRNVQSKKKKGSAGNISPGGISVREIPVSKPTADELIHVQKDVQFGENWCKIAVFIAISSALAGVGYYYALSGNDVAPVEKQRGSATLEWIKTLRFDLFGERDRSRHLEEFTHELDKQEPEIDEEPQSGNINRAADEAQILFANVGADDGDLADIAQTIAENLLDSINNEASETENKTLQDYLETPSNSAGEQSEDDSANEPSTGENIPIDSEKSETPSETESETDDEHAEYGKSSYSRMNITNRADWPYRHQLDEADDDWDREDYNL